MEPGRGGPDGDIEDLGHVGYREVELVVQNDDGSPVDIELIKLGHHPVALGDLR